jgi:hypothetical protein
LNLSLIAAARCAHCSVRCSLHTRAQRIGCANAEMRFIHRYEEQRIRLHQEHEMRVALARDMLMRGDPEESIVALISVLVAGPRLVMQSDVCEAEEAIDFVRWEHDETWRPLDDNDPRPHPGPQPEPEDEEADA